MVIMVRTFSDLQAIDPTVYWQEILALVPEEYKKDGKIIIPAGESIAVYFDGVEWKLASDAGIVNITDDESHWETNT